MLWGFPQERKFMRGVNKVVCRFVASWLVLVVIAPPARLSGRSIIEAGNETVWRYLDDGQAPDENWRGVEFDDTQWKSGPAPLGYGRPALGTAVGWGTDKDHRFITTWFRRSFERPELKPGECLVINFCVDDGAVFYLNGRELARENMPEGRLLADTTAPRAVGPNDEGFYLRIPVPVAALRGGRNVLAVEVHQCSPKSHDLFFDLELKTKPADVRPLALDAAARPAVDAFRHENYLGPDVKIPDGYEDGGHAMKFDAEGRPTSSREILLVDRARDVALAKDLAFARSPELQALPPLERARRLAVHIDQEATPPGGPRWEEQTCAQLEKEFINQPVLLGDWLDQAHAGVCRHRALLFKILADEAGLKAALVRGHYVGSSCPNGAQHAWNELFLAGGRRLLVDVTLQGTKPEFREVTTPHVVQHYRKQNNAPWYESPAP